MIKSSGKLITINGGTVGYIWKDENGKGWVASEYLQTQIAWGKVGLIVRGKTKKATAIAYGEEFLAR